MVNSLWFSELASGNSKFYDKIAHIELLYAAIMRQHGFTDMTVENHL